MKKLYVIIVGVFLFMGCSSLEKAIIQPPEITDINLYAANKDGVTYVNYVIEVNNAPTTRVIIRLLDKRNNPTDMHTYNSSSGVVNDYFIATTDEYRFHIKVYAMKSPDNYAFFEKKFHLDYFN